MFLIARPTVCPRARRGAATGDRLRGAAQRGTSLGAPSREAAGHRVRRPKAVILRAAQGSLRVGGSIRYQGVGFASSLSGSAWLRPPDQGRDYSCHQADQRAGALRRP